MQHEKIAATLKFLRLQCGLTQSELAERLCVSRQAVAKWECARSLPDLSLCAPLAALFGVGVEVILTGELNENKENETAMKNLFYYVCPHCQNLISATAKAEIHCCGRTLAPQTAQKAEEGQKMQLTPVEDEIYLHCDHPMQKDDYILFTAIEAGGQLRLTRHYPEWPLEMRLAKHLHGRLLWYSAKDGLRYQLF